MKNFNMRLGMGLVAASVLAGCSTTPAPVATKTPQASLIPIATGSIADQGVLVGGALMVKTNDIVANVMNSKDHTTLVAALQSAGLVDTLKGKGPFTMFAPTNTAFARFPTGVMDTLLAPASKQSLTTLLNYHVLSGAYRRSDLKDGMKLKTVQGEMLTVSVKNGKWSLIDAHGSSVNITIPDIVNTNGVTFIVDGVLVPTAFKTPVPAPAVKK